MKAGSMMDKVAESKMKEEDSYIHQFESHEEGEPLLVRIFITLNFIFLKDSC